VLLLEARKILFQPFLSTELSSNTGAGIKGAADVCAYRFLELFLQRKLKHGL